MGTILYNRQNLKRSDTPMSRLKILHNIWDSTSKQTLRGKLSVYEECVIVNQS